MDKIRININKVLLKTIGSILPDKRHPFGHIGNWCRNHFNRKIVKSLGKIVLLNMELKFLRIV